MSCGRPTGDVVHAASASASRYAPIMRQTLSRGPRERSRLPARGFTPGSLIRELPHQRLDLSHRVIRRALYTHGHARTALGVL